MAERIDPERVAYWSDLARRLRAAGHGARGALLDGAAQAQGISRATAFARLKQYGGWQSGRKRRADAGRLSVDPATLELVAGMLREGAHADGRQIMGLADAVSIAERSGHAVPVTNSQMGRYLRARRMDVRSQAQAEHFCEMRSLHPNHVHQVDPSLCVLYYLGGQQYLLRDEEFYKNKLEKVAKIQTKCWRYVLTDHYSGLILPRYYVQAGESQATLFEFLMWAWQHQEGRLGHGVPRLMLWDKGSANTAGGIKALLEALEVEAIAHAAERSNVKGQVETSQRIVERKFEARLKFQPVADVAALNEAAAHWARVHAGNLLYPRVDTRIRRPGAPPMVRADLWLSITPEQIRECPPTAVCARLLEGKRVERTVTPQAFVTYPHPAFGHSLKYSLRHLAELHRGDRVEIAPLLVGEDGAAGLIRLRWTSPHGEERTWRLAPELALDGAGRSLRAAVIGEEYREPKRRAAERVTAALDAAAYPQADPATAVDATEHARRSRQKNVTPFSGQLDAHGHLAGLHGPVYQPPRGAEVAVQAPEEALPPVPLVRALGRLREAWGRPITREEARWLGSRYGESIPETELARLLTEETVRRPLAVVNG